MATHYDDEAQVDAIKSWWKENWLALVGGLGLGLAAIFGWQTYQQSGEGRADRAAQMYSDLRNAQADSRTEAVAEIRGTLVSDYAKTPYAALAQLKWAAQSLKDERLDEARDALDWVVNNSSDDGLKAVARLRLARISLEAGDADAALAALTPVPSGFESLYLETRGDALLLKGERADARGAYDEALAAVEPNAPYRGQLQRKRDDLNEASSS
ncbi:YfgM family protein [Polycyclovorans algicola]|uniref:YfgM family protein n=1 Tax=Polycyclovorans algicola TaxID=616992 RepID=UPI0004A6BA8E|nr:tetratricopeptide repeat protein [Polycyclovorans algicola]